MNELPPDPLRLRVILTHLEQQLTDEETLVTYLRIQVEAVRRALAVAENRGAASSQPSPHRPHAPARPALGPVPNRMESGTPGFMIEQRRTPTGPKEAAVHLDDCKMTTNLTHSISAHDARLALTDAQLEACAFCRPDTELGILD
ncbi:DUF6233 domain-containing protein [Streptomyces phaeochromogenes]|uniref:DUF6233 domain-containing protein n=1 Tax=Streptomyces phaeochromogenes TaxID=1923 RepID=UPI002DDBC167|nr:DUF6233 domain-containing protein [Streptomyces phaeochromogenes]WRZ30205.1 DUF6233 domain-containing protein [Streptomyces phaeochromogenes]